MRKKSTAKLETKAEDPKALKIERQATESDAEMRAHTSLRPTVQAALTVLDYNKGFGEVSINTLVDDLVTQCEMANKGNLSRAEALLVTQAHTLDAVFNNLARRAQKVEYLSQFETNLRLALKAQNQCRATLETLAAIKNPQPVAFVKQANIAHGPQQVINGTAQGDTRAEKFETEQNEVLEHQNVERLDSRAPGAASGTDSAMETVGAIHRT